MYLRGSEWRRWDLHVHTPGTALNNQFGDWEEYLAAIEADRAVKVIGVTDYMTIANYSQLKANKQQGRIANIELLIPNIEFRIAPPSDKATAVNIHLLVSPDDLNHENEILNALGRLTWRYGPPGSERTYSCLPDQLMALGRAFNPANKDDRAALEAGVTQFKVDFTKLRDWFESEPWLRRNSLIAVAAGDDGLSGFQRDGAWGGYREEITRFSQILFSGRPGEREFWIGRRSPEDCETVMRLGGFKPCLHGSDAHSIAKLFRPDKDRFCWIKADPTFEGLRQVLYEPEDRVHIGPTPPLYHDRARVIRAVKLAHSGGWFSEHLGGMTVDLVWADDSVSQVRLGDEQSDENEVRYLSQKFVERLCTGDGIGAELVHEIEAVIFSYIDPTDTLNASNFSELRALLTEGIRAEGDRLREEVTRLIREECALRANAAKLTDKKTRINTLTEERAGLVKQMPQAASAEEAQVQADLQARRQALATSRQAAAAEKQNLQKIADVRTRIAAFKAQMVRFYTEIEPILNDAGVPEADRAAFRAAFPADTESPLARREVVLRRSISQREGASENPAEGTIRWLQAQIEALMKRESTDKAKQERTKIIQTRIAAIDTEITRLQAEIAQIEGPEKVRIASARQERLEAYVAFFTNLQMEQQTLEKLYDPVSTRLRSEAASPQERDLAFSIRWEADLPTWFARGAALFDQRTTIPFGTIKGLEDAVRKILVPAWISGKPEQISSALEGFLAEFRKPEPRPAKYLRADVSVQDVLQWLYEVDHVRLSYGLKYNGAELEKLSPGTKGIVLLILYLGMDVADTRPLIVDQPDEILDNESIYELLMAYFREAKTRRQILLITHNPNLVVNGDSEQVIVATASRRGNELPHITYRSGALENITPQDKGIRQQVCRILEGGSDAFRRRERRYALGLR